MKRSQTAIIQQILKICKDGASKTQVVYQANLNFRTVEPYLHLMVKQNLLEVLPGDKMLYKTTQKGEDLQESIDHADGYTLATRRGYVVHLEKGKEGIHKKFDEVLSSSLD